jgi:hypothetical protein
MLNRTAAALAFVLASASAEPAGAQQVRAGLLTCDVSAGIGLIITSQKDLSCVFTPERSDISREEYESGRMSWSVDRTAP